MATEGTPTVAPMLAYEDGPAAMDWLVRAFGFVEQEPIVNENGVLGHGALSFGDGVVMLATPSPDYEGPRRHRAHCERAAAWSRVPYVIDGVHVSVPDVGEHLARAVAAGATMLSEPTETPWGRQYRAEDPEGHRWTFMQPN